VPSTMARMGARRPSIADVAREAGVSKASVSFAFNQPGRLRPETTDRIRAVAASLGYRPHPVARILKQRRTMMLGVLTPQALPVVFANPWFCHLAEGIATGAAASGYGIAFIAPLGGSLASATGRALVDGIVCVGLSLDHPEVEALRAEGVPMVLADSDRVDGISSVEVDDEAGARLAADHLLALGHRDVVVLAVEAPVYPRRETAGSTATAAPGVGSDYVGGASVVSRRIAGYRAAFRAASLDLPDDRIISGPATVEGGRACLRRAWASGLRPTGVLCMSDAIAIGALDAARELGLRVPGDLSVVGFDDIDFARFTEPSLTTVHQPIRRKGEEVAHLLLSTLGDGGATVEHRRMETRLVVRSSSGAARPSGQEVVPPPSGS
jgi:DNA-binding LacI/PurR family transcriptional regulator